MTHHGRSLLNTLLSEVNEELANQQLLYRVRPALEYWHLHRTPEPHAITEQYVERYDYLAHIDRMIALAEPDLDVVQRYSYKLFTILYVMTVTPHYMEEGLQGEFPRKKDWWRKEISFLVSTWKKGLSLHVPPLPWHSTGELNLDGSLSILSHDLTICRLVDHIRSLWRMH